MTQSQPPILEKGATGIGTELGLETCGGSQAGALSTGQASALRAGSLTATQ